ncbi:hypothetical protein PGH07_01295 [Sulfurovum sp. zt1-1]|uniref:Rhodanese domain-containing protein n=1 Tax=Sulfurovum zhangzhouensis TaxID=3019067 RepID=A0ABT7QVE4_9BACT|nr:hypothetical protein [Sulfurovum zhangzhouensis]MDM5270807.1 hypothetical protein [Sulfurovum zhangzhouensis]
MNKKEWTQEEYLIHKKHNEENGIQTILVDTVNVPIDGMDTVLYNPYELQSYPEGTVLVFYCDTGKTTMERLEEYQKRFPGKECISLRGGRGYWRRACSI